MARFKFTCSCGKRLAAQDWMVGQLITCPRCEKTMTVPTPFQAEETYQEMMEKGYVPARPKIGQPVDPNAHRRRMIIVVVIAAAVVLITVLAIWVLLIW
jgi:hypothetical protein